MKFAKAYPLLAVLLTVFAVAPLEYPGAFQSHTGLLAYYNLIDLDQRPFQFFNWAPTLGSAFDLFRTEGALPYVVALILHRVGFSYLDAIKLVYALAWVGSGLAMFAFARRFLSDAGALLATTVYVYLPYHIATVYVRGAFAESVAWMWFPLVLLALVSQQSTVNSQQKFAIRNFVAPLLTFATFVLIQPGMAILFAPVAFSIVLAIRGRSGIRHSLFAILGGLALGAILFAPTILRYGAHIARDGFNANFVLPFQLFSALWGFGASTGNFLDQFPFQLGVVPMGLAIVAIALAWQERANEERNDVERSGERSLRHIVIIFLAGAMVLTLLTFEITSPLWRGLGVFVEYPWQLLAFVGLALAFIAGSAIEFDARLTRPAMLAFFIALPVIASYSYLAPRFLDARPTRPPIAIFNDEVALLDYRIVGPLRHGATLRVYLTWQALRPVYTDYNVFVHAVHENGERYGQSDNKPQNGALPMIKWMPGEVIFDLHKVQIDVDGPDEGFHLELGIYKPATGERALTERGADHLTLPRPGDPEPIVSDQLAPSK
ncbi:MAG: hypothetical protein HY868_01250 [Chloroflexi bacterium]|nr:hypothetical protein [Chloroflexota bacterium]